MELFFGDTKILATIIHVISVVFGMGAALTSDVLFTFFSKDKKLNKTELKTLDVLSTIVLYSLGIIIVSGIFIFLSDPNGYMSSSKFLAKMSILFVLILNGYLLNKYVWSHLLKKNFFAAKSERGVRKMAFVMGTISVVSWIAVLTLGVLDQAPLNYIGIMSLYGLILVPGMVVSQIIEKKEFN